MQVKAPEAVDLQQESKATQRMYGMHAKETAAMGRSCLLARRLAEKIQSNEGCEVPVGLLDINLYRDDLDTIADHPVLRKTEIPFAVDGHRVILVDDVCTTGATLNACADVLMRSGAQSVTGLVIARV